MAKAPPCPGRQPQGRFGPQPFRRQVKQVELAVHEGVLDPAALVGILGRVEEARPHAEHGQRVDLIRMSAMSGEMTTPAPSRTSAGIW